MNREIKITGLDCGKCALDLEDRLKKTEGVSSAHVDFVRQRVRLDCDGEKSYQKAIEQINGFEDVRVVEQPSRAGLAAAHKREIVCVALSFVFLAAGIVLLVAMTGLDQDMMQRNLSCATPRDSQKNIVLTAVSQIFVIFLFLVLGVLLYLYAARTGMALPEKSDQVFSLVAVEGGLPLVVGILFVVGLISSTYSAAGSALTALTTSFTVDILEGPKRMDDVRLTRLRKGVHVGMALGMAAVILAFEYWADDSVINLVYKVASYTYGPILGMFAFGMVTRRRVRDRWIPPVAVLAPVLSALLQTWARKAWDYQIGFELLIYNAAFTMIGMWILSQKNEK